jgi:hypothetical protein
MRVNELKAAQENLAEVYERMSDIFAREREELRGRMQQQEVTIDRGDLAPKLADMARWGAFRQSVADNADEIERLAGDMAKFADEGYSAAQIEAVFGARMEDVIERAKVLGVTLDKSTVSILRQKSEAQKLADSFEDTFGSISDNLVDMIVDFDFSFRRLKDIGLSTAKSLGRSFLDGFFKPFKDQLEGLGRKVGQWASGLLFGGSAAQAQQGQQQGGLLGGLLGGVGGNLLGKIFGRGSGQGGLLGGIFGGGGVDAAAGNPAMALAGQNPVALGLQIADKAVDLYNKTFGRIGAGRRSANEIVKSEDTFVKQTLAGILADSSLSATNKLKLVTNEFQMFQDNLARFSAAGDKNVITANQSFATVSPLVANIKRDLIAQGAVEGGGDGSGGTVQHITVAPGAIVLQLTDVHTPEEFISWLDKNKAGMAIRIAERVLALEGAIVTR